MKQEIKEKWVAALRSGEYSQCRSVLRRGDSFCCLGVLSDLAVKDGVGKWGERNPTDGDLPFLYQGDNFGGYLPEPVKAWAELDTDNPTIGGDKATHHNDNMILNFMEIADMIEAEL